MSIAAVLLAALAGPATAGPLTFEIQPPLEGGEISITERAKLELATDGPAPEEADEITAVLTTMASAAPHDRITLAATIAVMWRGAELSSPAGDRVERTAGGLGDLTIYAASPLRGALGGGALVVAPYAGLKIPTGSDDESDGFGRLPQRLQVGTGAFDLPLGAIASWAHPEIALHTAATYAVRTEANEFDAGDSLRWDFAAHRSIARSGDLELIAALETHALWRFADRGRLAPAESGGLSWYGAPGLLARLGRHAIEGAVEIPFVQPFDTHIDAVVRAGYRLEVGP